MLELFETRLDQPFPLAPISARVEGGQLLGLIGPNGAGKSTLLSLISGYRPPHSGEVRLLGRQLEDYPAQQLARHRALVTQQAENAFDWRVRDFIRLGQAHAGAPLPGILEALDILHLLERGVQSLSGGELQRVTIARALNQLAISPDPAPAGDELPRMLLLDEPTSALDIGQQQSLMRLLRRLACRPGTAVVCVLHDLNLAARYCDRLWLLEGGHLQADGPPSQVLTAGRIAQVFGAQAKVRVDEDRALRIELIR